MPAFEGQLKTFQVASLNPSNLNCVLTRDKAIQSIIYRISKSPEGTSSISNPGKSASLNLGLAGTKKSRKLLGKQTFSLGGKSRKITFQPQN